ncbi:unnamed protein product [Clonostachys rhizophaga]|uniref:NADP-dependent oxidoreductase domain-containing protein n=1 Tax=Clonostachys rhizophaga TaxID=160324 RepID=A0A9N9VIX1_9HYPO|nr:unnamed protein product [Clonostachys rhizophaga]
MSSSPILRQVGQNGPRIPAVGFGLMGLSIAYGPVGTDEERLKVLDRAWELGCTNWDTSNAYGDSEVLVGKWFKLHPERRKDIFLATKFGITVDGSGMKLDSSPEHCKACIEKSLERLGVEYVDLYYLHRVNTEVPIEKTVKAMSELVKEGKVKLLGLSEISSSTLRRAHAIHPIAAVQVEYSPWTLDIEGPSGTYLLNTCKELGVSIFAYSPLGRGIMTGRVRSAADFGPDDFRSRLERFQGENFQKNLDLVDKFGDLAKSKGYAASQMALAWLTAQSDLVFVIPGTKSIKYLEENWGAAGVKLTEKEEQDVRRFVEDADLNGTRGALLGHYLDTAPLNE